MKQLYSLEQHSNQEKLINTKLKHETDKTMEEMTAILQEKKHLELQITQVTSSFEQVY